MPLPSRSQTFGLVSRREGTLTARKTFSVELCPFCSRPSGHPESHWQTNVCAPELRRLPCDLTADREGPTLPSHFPVQTYPQRPILFSPSLAQHTLSRLFATGSSLQQSCMFAQAGPKPKLNLWGKEFLGAGAFKVLTFMCWQRWMADFVSSARS